MIKDPFNSIKKHSDELKKKLVKELKPHHLYFFMTCIYVMIICGITFILRNDLLSENLLIKRSAISILASVAVKSFFNVLIFGTILTILFSIYKKCWHLEKKKRDAIYTISVILLIAFGFMIESLIFQRSNSEKLAIFINQIISEKIQ